MHVLAVVISGLVSQTVGKSKVAPLPSMNVLFPYSASHVYGLRVTFISIYVTFPLHACS